jgi:hypothetical protein
MQDLWGVMLNGPWRQQLAIWERRYVRIKIHMLIFLHAQINSLVAMMPDVLLLEDKSGAIPHGGRDLVDGYVLLRACQPTAIDISEPEATVIMKLWDAKGWPNRDCWPQAVCQWACLQLPNGQIACSYWMES